MTVLDESNLTMSPTTTDFQGRWIQFPDAMSRISRGRLFEITSDLYPACRNQTHDHGAVGGEIRA